MATRKDRSAGYIPIIDAVEALQRLAADFSNRQARGDRRLVKVTVQVYYGDEEPLEGERASEPPPPEEPRHERTERLADRAEDYGASPEIRR